MEDIVSASVQSSILNKAAEAFRQEIITELNNSNIPADIKDEIEQSLIVETHDDKSIHLKVKTNELKNIEYGSTRLAENAVVLRARNSLENAISKILQSELNKSKTIK